MQDIGAENFRAVRSVETGSWLGRAHQGQGIGREMREAVLHLAFAGLGAEEALSGAFEDNAASLATSRAVGLRRERRGQGPAPRRVGPHDPLPLGPRRLGAPSPRRHRDPRARRLPRHVRRPGHRRRESDEPGGAGSRRRALAELTEPLPQPTRPLARTEPTTTGHRRDGSTRSPSVSWRSAVLALAYGLVLRGWLLVQVPLWGDEAIVGIMARAIDGGHFTAFIWGQHYGGLEPYVTALVLKVGGGGEPALNATPALLGAARRRPGGRPRLCGRAKPAGGLRGGRRGLGRGPTS